MLVWCKFPEDDLKKIEICCSLSELYMNVYAVIPVHWLVEHVWNVMPHAQKPDFVFQRNGQVHLNWRGGGSVQSTTGSRGVRISGSNGSYAGYTMFWGRVQDYWLSTPLACFPFTSPTVRHRVPSGFNWAVHQVPTRSQPVLLPIFCGTRSATSHLRNSSALLVLGISLCVSGCGGK